MNHHCHWSFNLYFPVRRNNRSFLCHHSHHVIKKAITKFYLTKSWRTSKRKAKLTFTPLKFNLVDISESTSGFRNCIGSVCARITISGITIYKNRFARNLKINKSMRKDLWFLLEFHYFEINTFSAYFMRCPNSDRCAGQMVQCNIMYNLFGQNKCLCEHRRISDVWYLKWRN